MQLTALETKALAALRAKVESRIVRGEVEWGTVYLDNAFEESEMSRQSWSGVLSSLNKKGLYRPEDGDFRSQFGDVVTEA